MGIASSGRFDPDFLPSPMPTARTRWLRHAITPGAQLAAVAHLTMTGEIRLGKRWHRFDAEQVLAPGHGYIWAAKTSVLGFPVVGFDGYSFGSGEMHRRLFGWIPIISVRGADVTRSAAGRLACELALLPSAYATARWNDDSTPSAAHSQSIVDGHVDAVNFDIDPDGRLTRVRCQRWGKPDKQRWGEYPFEVQLADEVVFCGIRVPTTVRAAWMVGPDAHPGRELFRAQISNVHFPLSDASVSSGTWAV